MQFHQRDFGLTEFSLISQLWKQYLRKTPFLKLPYSKHNAADLKSRGLGFEGFEY